MTPKQQSISDIYPLSPLQRGILFESLVGREQGAYFEQFLCRFDGGVSLPDFEAAWQDLVDRHAVLRTAFITKGQTEPVQVVLAKLPISLNRMDWSLAPATEQEQRLEDFLKADRAKGFELNRAPLLRFTLIRLGAAAWQFVWSHHHIILDGWSHPILMAELLAIYESHRSGRPLSLKTPPPYQNHIAWLRQQDKSSAEAYWRRTLAGFDRPTPLGGFDNVRFRGPGAQGRVELRFTREETEAIEAAARRYLVSVNNIFQAAWALLLSRYCGESKVVFGVTVSGRSAPLPGIAEMVGLLINTLPFSCELRATQTFAEWVAGVAAAQREMLRFESTDLADLHRWSEVPSDLPLFESALIFENLPSDDQLSARVKELRIRDVRLIETTSFPLALIVVPGREILLRIVFHSARFERERMENLAAHLRHVLRQAAQDGSRVLAAFSVVPPDEIGMSLSRSPSLSTDTPTLGQLFARTVAAHRTRVAVTGGGESLTYDQLDRASNELARELRRRGVGPETFVGICLERTARQVVAMLAVIKAGGAYVPLDPAHPEERLEFIAADSGCLLVLTDAHLKARLERVGCPLVCWERPVNEAPELPLSEAAVRADNAAYVIYTSGSTGRPKGVVVTHRNVTRLFETSRRQFDFVPTDVWSYFHAFSFDFSVWEIWGALLHGARIAVIPYLTSRDPEAFYRVLASEQVTILSQTPSAFRLLMDYERSLPRALPLALRYVVFGGEALDPSSLAPWFERHPFDCPKTINMYGITETTVHVTYRQILTSDSQSAGKSVIGEALPDLRILLLDAYGNPVPDGIAGEICVSGPGLARGYLGAPELTAARFVPHPAPASPGERLYRSGDLALRTPGGELVHLGRLDRQIKIRGHRVEPGEIAAAIESHPSARRAFVQLLREEGHARLVAHVVAEPAPPVEELREHLSKRLPGYMTPESFVFVASFPMTVNGKIDVKALPRPDRDRSLLAGQYVAPENEAEQKLAAIWQTVLGVPRVGVHDNYFALGGDSILSLRIVSMAKDQGLEISLQSLFELQTIAGLAAKAKHAAPEAEVRPFELISVEDRALLPAFVEDAYPLGRLQAGMLFHSEYGDGQQLYIDSFSFRMRGPVDPAAWRLSLQQAIARHPALRTGFRLEGFSAPLQLVHGDVEAPLEVFDLRALPADMRDAQAERWVRQTVSSGFDWTAPPLFRVVLHRLEEDVTQLSLVMHHAILDGWSVASLLAEWGLHIESGRAPEPPRSRFSEFIALERASAASDAQREFWKNELSDSVPAVVEPWAASTTEHGHRKLNHAFSPELSRKVAAFARARRLPLKTVLLAAHLRALEELTGERDLVTGLVSNGRPETTDSTQTLGLFLNTIPLRWKSPSGSWEKFCEAVFQRESELLPFRRFPLAEMDRSFGTAPFETSFNFIQFHVLQAFAKASRWGLLSSSSEEAVEFPLSVNFSSSVDGDVIHLGILYDAGKYPREQVEGMARLLDDVLTATVEHPRHAHRDFEASTGDRDRGFLLLANATDTPVDRLAPARIAALANAHPQRTSVLAEGEALTYGDLERWSGQVAHHLITKGLERDQPVALLMERSLELIVAMLGIWKAGAFYVPIEPDLPPARAEAILAESGARYTLTREIVAGLRSSPAVANRPVEIHPEQLAYVLFTSGSTGKPKGVGVRHFALANQIQWLEKSFPLTPDDSVLQKTPYGFDASLWEFWFPLCCGAKLVMAPPDSHRDPRILASIVQRERISILQLVPTMLEALTEEPELDRCASLRILFCGGEVLKTATVRAFQKKLPIPVVNLYGPTEATIQSSAKEFDDHETGATMGIGWPLDNNRYYVLNSSLQQAPVGAAGELHIGGSVLARGYWRQPDLTAERFLPDPFSSQPGGRMYRTGDRVRWLPDGRLEFLGRLDDQVKIGGSRIELGEVESALAQCARGRRAAVLPINRQLVAFVEAKEAIDAPAIRSALRERLPSYMVPARIVAVEVWPLLASGKTNRRALAAMEPRAESSRPRSLPTSEKERLLLALWQRLLPGAVASIEENFFELGGDSILSLQLVALARKQGLALTPKQVFDHPTIRDLARVAGKPEEGPGAPAVFEGSLPLTPIQLAFFEQKPPTPNYWNQSVLLTLKEPFSVDRLKDSVLALLERHDVFRLRFRFDGDRWSQHYGPLCGSWEERDCAREDLERRCSEAQAGLDIENGPLFRAVLFRLSDGGFRLLLAVHHLIVDGVSWRILLEEIASNSRPALTMPFGVWARRLASPEVSSQMKRDLDFWIEQTAPVRALPTDFSNGPNTEGSASTVDGELTAEETSALLASAPASLKATAEELLLLSVATAVSEWIGESAVLLNVESNGREDATGDLDLTSTVGWFTALYPLRLDVPQTASAEERLSGLKPQMRARPKAAASYGALRYQVKSPELQTAHAEISINFLGQFDSTFPDDAPFLPAEESGGEQYAADSPRQHLLDFIAGVSGGKLNLQVRYSRNIHARGTVARLLDSVLETLRSALALCGAPRPSAWSASDFPLARLDESEFRHLAETHWPFVDLLPLTPVQEGMLFHSVEQGPESGVYVQQLVIHAHGMCDLPRLREAWQALLRYPQLRASFARHDLRTPIAVIPPEAPMEWQHVDWRENSEADRSFAEWLDQDRLRRFVLEQAPLLRLAVFQLANDEWRLVWTHHHALLDGWSIPTILAEVLSHYAGIPTDPMPSLAWREYLDWLSRQDPASAESFWRDHLSGFTEPLLLSERESSTREAVSSASANWTSGETATLLEFARGRQVTLNTLIQAAWAFVIGRTARTEDVVFGATVSGRPTELAGAESAIGMYINTLPVRCSLAPAQTVDQWLLSVQSNQQRVLEHQHSRLVDIHRWSDCAGQPLFESIVVFESYPMDAVAGQLTGNFTIREVRAVEQNHYPLSLYVLPGREIRFTLMFECSRIPAKLASRLLEQFQFVLRSLPRARFVGELGLALEVAASVPGPGDDARSQPQAFVPERFERIAMRTPDSFALCFGEERLTYRELHRRVLRRARELRARNVRQETLTAIFLERSVDMVVSLLATLCAGGAYLPIDPAFPAERIARILDVGKPFLVITEIGLKDRIPSQFPVLVVDEQRDDEPGPLEDARPRILPRQLAYTIFTSGSTGWPNGVAITHEALLNILESFEQRPGITADDVLVSVTTLSFDIATLEILLPLVTGAILHLASRAQALDGVELARVLRESNATVMQATPATWRMLLAAEFRPASRFRAWCGGEALPPDLAVSLLKAGFDLWNLYGPTETTIWSSCKQIRDGSEAPTIGTPVARTQLYVLDSAGNKLPSEIIGDLWIGGVGLSRGYCEEPALTADRFRPDAFSDTPGARIYRTGDLACLLPSGEIEFHGRNDFQVKVDGYRIELGDIESALAGIAEVAHAAAAVQSDAAGRRFLVGYVVSKDGMPIDPEYLRLSLSGKLPDYMIPSRWVMLAALPLTPNRKLDRKALPAGDLVPAAAPVVAMVEARNPVEEALAEMWKDAFGLGQIGVTADFFELGGHSLLATQIHVRITRRFQTDLRLRDLFRHRTIESLAQLLTAQESRPGAAEKIARAWLTIRRMTPEQKKALAARAQRA